VAEVEKKVVQMIGNFTHKEWECAQRILKHQGRVNHVFDEMGVTYSPRPVPPTASKKMQPPGNIGSEPVETSRKTKSSKTTVTVDNVVKNTKAQDTLAKRKADAAKATLPLLAEKSTKLLKVNETLARRKAEAAKVAAVEREKKKIHDPSLLVMQIRDWLRRRGLQKLQRGGDMLRSRKRSLTRTSPLGKGHGLIQSQRLMRTLASCRRLRSSLALIIPRRGQR
jgi:hypothetical protein